jgi:hypothetical protein
MRISHWVPHVTDAHSRNMEYLLLFPCSNGRTNAPQSYIIHTLPVWFYITVDRFPTLRNEAAFDNLTL